MDLLKLVQKLPSAPPFFKEEILDKFGAKVVLPQTSFPKSSFASKRRDALGRNLPQIVAHRGYKTTYPENSIRAFEDAVDAGAHALETDLHLTKDGVVVLSHDRDLKRCFGIDRQIKDCDWDFLQTLRTTRMPHEPLARLRDLLHCFERPQWQSTWLLLDVKFDDDPTTLVRHIRETFRQVDPENRIPWASKVLLGYWTAEYIPLYSQYFPGFAIQNIGFSDFYSRHFLAVSHTSFSIIQATLVSPSGQKFLREVQARNLQIFSWTNNEDINIEWCIRRGLDGIITDNVPRALELCETLGEEKSYPWTVKVVIGRIIFNFWLYVFTLLFRRRYGTCIEEEIKVNKNK